MRGSTQNIATGITSSLKLPTISRVFTRVGPIIARCLERAARHAAGVFTKAARHEVKTAVATASAPIVETSSFADGWAGASAIKDVAGLLNQHLNHPGARHLGRTLLRAA